MIMTAMVSKKVEGRRTKKLLFRNRNGIRLLSYTHRRGLHVALFFFFVVFFFPGEGSEVNPWASLVARTISCLIFLQGGGIGGGE